MEKSNTFLSLKAWCEIYQKENLLKEYSPKNIFSPEDIPYNAVKRVKWKCSVCGYEWEDLISNRTHQNWPTDCPKCSKTLIENDLIDFSFKTRCLPLYEHEWAKNNTKGLEEILKAGSPKKVKWVCPICHKIHCCSVEKKTRNGKRVCNSCRSKYFKTTSFPEQALIFYVKKLNKNFETNKIIDGNSFDIWLPEEKIAIKYDSYFNRYDKKTAQKVDDYCEENNIKLVRIRSYDLEEGYLTKSKIFKRLSPYDLDLSRVIKAVLDFVEANTIEVNVTKDNYEIIDMAVKQHNYNVVNNVPFVELSCKHKDTKLGTNKKG